MSASIAGRKRRSRDQWQQLLDEYAGSGQTQTAFCQAQGLCLSSFQNWKRRLACSEPSPAWVELGGVDRAPGSSWQIDLELGAGVCQRLRRC